MTEKPILKMREYEYIEMRRIPHNGKTFKWEVVNRDSLQAIGEIKWYGRWRQYCFFPDQWTVFSTGCMQDIVHFINLNKQIRVIP